jgi:5-oxoprolinase (ATP-hydrolysing)
VVSILSERRAFEPYGLEGGENGARGMNLVVYKDDERTINLGGKNTIHVKRGDKLIINTPGGGGYGTQDSIAVTATASPSSKDQLRMTSGSLNQYALNQESV